MAQRRVTRDELTQHLAGLQESIPGVRAFRRSGSVVMAVAAVLALVVVLVLGRRPWGRDRRS